MSAQTELIEKYNEFLLESAVKIMTGELTMEDYPAVLAPYLADDVKLHEGESLPWGGWWYGREGFGGEGQAFLGAFGPRFRFEAVADEFSQVSESLVFHTFTIAIITLDDETIRYEWRGVERYEFATDGRISLIDVYYKDTAGLMEFISA